MRLALVAFVFLISIASFSGMSVAQEAGASNDAQQLIDLLQNDEAREALIDSLRQLATPVEAAPELDERISFGRQIAWLTSGFVETAAGSLTAAFSGVASVIATLGALDGDQFAVLIDALIALAVVFIATTVSYVVLRYFAKSVFQKMGARTLDWNLLRTFVVLIATTIIDALVVILAWGLGYLAALYLHGDPGTMGVRQAVLLPGR